MNQAYLLSGSNEGDREQWLSKASELIAAKCGQITIRSSLYETAAWGMNNQPDFLNMVMGIDTMLEPMQLLEAIKEIEQMLERQHTVKWGPRTLDIDILTYNDEIIKMPLLTIPHPFLHQRRFTLAPFDEIAPDYLHPVLKKTIHQLLDECIDMLTVKKYNFHKAD